ncbi:hypothetical protein BN440_3690 [Erwinia amylovora MR1]|nr:hypothetical protein BN440_3690 [Erwinia amylovora MR1]
MRQCNADPVSKPINARQNFAALCLSLPAWPFRSRLR